MPQICFKGEVMQQKLASMHRWHGFNDIRVVVSSFTAINRGLGQNFIKKKTHAANLTSFTV